MNRLVLAQIDTIAGNIKYNAEKIINCINKAKENNADLIIFPELVLIGYPFGDIIMRHKSVIEQQLAALEEIASNTQNITALIGFAEPTNAADKKPFYNSVAVVQNGKIINIIRKRLLPNYGEFNDYRYFEPSQEVSELLEINGEKYGILSEKLVVFSQGPCYNTQCMKTGPAGQAPGKRGTFYVSNRQEAGAESHRHHDGDRGAHRGPEGGAGSVHHFAGG